jgi:LacI family transcriptional regulator
LAVTLRHVAQKAGVSTATVSRILTGNKAEVFPEATRLKVHAAAEQLGYRPNFAARSLQMRRSFLLGVLMNAANASITTEFLRGVQSVLNLGDYSPIVLSHADCEEQADCLRRCTDRRVDGLIVNASHNASGQFDTSELAAVVERGTPLVEVFGRFLPDVAQFNVDNAAAGRKSVEYLYGLGHRRIAMLTHERYVVGAQDSAPGAAAKHWDAWERYLGYESVMKEAGLEPLVLTHPISGEVDVEQQFMEGGVEAHDRLLEHPSRPTAVVCYNDIEAYGLIRGARIHRVHSLSIPQRLSVVGFGDFDYSRIITPSLTTVPIPAFEVGKRAAEALMDRIDEEAVEGASIASELVVRESTAELAK